MKSPYGVRVTLTTEKEQVFLVPALFYFGCYYNCEPASPYGRFRRPPFYRFSKKRGPSTLAKYLLVCCRTLLPGHLTLTTWPLRDITVPTTPEPGIVTVDPFRIFLVSILSILGCESDL